MDTTYKRVKNHSPRSQAIIFDGKQVSLPPGESEVDSALAEAFVAESPHVSWVEDQVGVAYDAVTHTDNRVWVANMTGNPDAPEKIKTKIYKDKHWQQVEIDNPLKPAKHIKKMMGGAMVEVVAKDGTPEGLNMFPTKISLPPYTRAPIPPHIANWMFNRDAGREREYRGEIIRSRAPSDFEPNMNWPIPDIALYLRFMDPDVGDIPHEESMRKKALRHARDDWKALHGHPKTMKNEDVDREAGSFIEKAVDRKMHEMKKDLLKRVFFRTANPDYRLPTRQEFEALKFGEKNVTDMQEEQEIGVVVDALKTAEGQLAQDGA